MAEEAQPAVPSSLDRLAASRQSGSHPITVLQRRTGDRGRTRTTVQCSTAADSPVSALLLSAFQQATTPASRAQAGQGLLPRSLEIALAPAPSATRQLESGEQQPNGGMQQLRQEGTGLIIGFTTTEPAAEAQADEAARLFEARTGMHVVGLVGCAGCMLCSASQPQNSRPLQYLPCQFLQSVYACVPACRKSCGSSWPRTTSPDPTPQPSPTLFLPPGLLAVPRKSRKVRPTLSDAAALGGAAAAAAAGTI